MKSDYDWRSQDRRKTDQAQKALIVKAYKEAIKEWLDDVYKRAGKWTLIGIIAWTFTAFLHFLLTLHGKHFTSILDQLSNLGQDGTK